MYCGWLPDRCLPVPEVVNMRHLGKVQAFLAFVVTAGFFGAFWLVTERKVTGDMRDALLILLGNLSGAFLAVVTYYFGSSSGSAAKNQLLADKDPG